MARKKTVTPAEQVGPTFMAATPSAMAEPEARRNQVQAAYTDERDLVNQVVGRAQMAFAVESFSRTVRVSDLSRIKESKSYKSLAGTRIPNRPENLAGTWEDFCDLLGRSVDQVDADIANLRAFGEDTLDSMARMGIGYREMRDFRRLPTDERLALIDVAKAGDKDALLDLAETLIARHTKEKEALTQRVDELSANAEAADKIIAGKEALINKQEKSIAKLQRHVETLPPDEKLASIRAELLGYAVEVEAGVVNKLRPAFRVLMDHITEHGGNCDDYLAGCIGQIERACRELREEFNLNQADVAAWASLPDHAAD